MRQESFFVETPMPKGCVTCKKRHLRCDEREPACKRCINSGRECEGYVCVSTARKPTDVTPESVLEFRQKHLPSREYPRKALSVLPIVEEPRVLYSFAQGLAAPDAFMHYILRVMVSGRAPHQRKEGSKQKCERDMALVKFHEQVKNFDMSRPEGCPVVRSAFMVQMYRIMIDIMMSRTPTSDKALQGLFVSNSQGRRK